MRTLRSILSLLCGALCVIGVASALPGPARAHEDPKPAEEVAPAPVPISYLEIARQSIVDGDMDRAVRALVEARACWQQYETACGFSRVDYQSLVGVVYLEHHHYDKAVEALAEVVREQPQRTAAWLYLGQALYYEKRYPESLEALRRAVDVGKDMKGYHLLVSRAELASGDPQAARRTLIEGLGKYPGERTLLRDMTLLYAEHGLFRTAVEVGRRYLDAADSDVFAHLLVADAMRNAGAVEEALPVLEEAHLVAPGDEEVLARLAYAYAEAEKPYAAARLFERLHRRTGKHAFETAEQYRILGRTRLALKFNGAVEEPKRRVTQRLAILLGDESFFQAAEMVDEARRAGALDDPTRYRLAYAAIRARKMDVAGALLGSIRTEALESGKKRLQDVLDRCREQPALCP